MRIADFIEPDLVIACLGARSKQGIIEEMAARIALQRDEIDKDDLTRVLMNRENLSSTAIGHGVAIPHGKLASLQQITACIGRVVSGVDFEAIDGAATTLFVVLVAPENSTGTHLKALARVSRIFRSEEFRNRLLEASGDKEMYEVLVEEDAKY